MPLDAARLRGDFPILSRRVRGKPLTYLDNAATTQKPRQVLDAVRDVYESHYANIHRGIHTLSEEATAVVEEARGKVARFIHAPAPESVVFTRNATEAINLVAHAWGRKFVRPGDELLLTELEHHSNLVPWQMLAAERGARLKFVPAEPDGTLDPVAARRLITPRTKLVAFTAVSNALGSISPVRELTRLARESGALVLLDGSQWVPHFETDVSALDCDFLAFSGHKMLSPGGVGVLWGRADLLEAMDPFLGGGDMIREVWLEKASYAGLPNKFEAGTPAIAEIAGLGAAVEYLSAVGLAAIREHELELTRKALDLLRGEPEVTVYGPEEPERRGGVVSFNVADVHPHDVGQVFDAEGVAIRAGHHCCQPLMRKLDVPGTARASFYLYNTVGELDAVSRALKRIRELFKLGAGARS